jgi:hypothetical protein
MRIGMIQLQPVDILRNNPVITDTTLAEMHKGTMKTAHLKDGSDSPDTSLPMHNGLGQGLMLLRDIIWKNT